MTKIILNNDVIVISDGNSRFEVPISPYYRVYKDLKDGVLDIEIDTFEGKEFIKSVSNDVIVIDNRKNE